MVLVFDGPRLTDRCHFNFVMSANLLTLLKETNLRIAQLETDLSKERATKSALVDQLKKAQKQQVSDAMDGTVGGVKRIKTEGGSPEVKQELAESVGEKGIDGETVLLLLLDVGPEFLTAHPSAKRSGPAAS